MTDNVICLCSLSALSVRRESENENENKWNLPSNLSCQNKNACKDRKIQEKNLFVKGFGNDFLFTFLRNRKSYGMVRTWADAWCRTASSQMRNLQDEKA